MEFYYIQKGETMRWKPTTDSAPSTTFIQGSLRKQHGVWQARKQCAVHGEPGESSKCHRLLCPPPGSKWRTAWILFEMELNNNPKRFKSWHHAVNTYFTPGDRDMPEMSQEMYLQARHEYPVESIHGAVQAVQRIEWLTRKASWNSSPELGEGQNKLVNFQWKKLYGTVD